MYAGLGRRRLLRCVRRAGHAARIGPDTRYPDRVTDRECIPAHQDLLYQQAGDFLPFSDRKRIRPQPQLGTEISERFRQAQAVGLVGSGRFQRLQFGLDRLLLFAEFRHPTAKLFQAYQTFLIGVQQAVHALLQPGMFAA